MVNPLLPLSGLRIAATVPPPAWFGGVDHAFALDMAAEIRNLGAKLLPVDVSGFVSHSPDYSLAAIRALRSFRPDLVISLPNAGYALLCTTPDGENIFRDVLEVPTIMIWDHALHQFSRLLLGGTDASSRSCIELLRAALDHRLFVHYSPDKGHIAAMDSLGILSANKVRPFIHFAFPTYARRGGHPAEDGGVSSPFAFAGNIYLDSSRNLPYHNHPALAGIESRMLAAKERDITRSFWSLLMDEIERCDESTRNELGLIPECFSFWSFVNDEVQVVGTTESRLAVLGGLKRECNFFGNFMEPHMAGTLRDEYGICVRGNLNCVSELPLLYQRSALIVDVINAGYISGVSPKVPSCLASGGLIVFDYKEDFREAVGEVAELVMYRSLEEMHSLIEGYLGDSLKRRKVARDLQQLVLRSFTFDTFCRKALTEEAGWRA